MKEHYLVIKLTDCDWSAQQVDDYFKTMGKSLETVCKMEIKEHTYSKC